MSATRRICSQGAFDLSKPSFLHLFILSSAYTDCGIINRESRLNALKNKIKTIFGSDCPIENLNPLKGIYAAITRKREDEDEKSFYPKEKIEIKEAVLGFTRCPAVISGEEKIKGSIQVGKLADMIVLSDDIFKVPLKEIPNIEVLATIFDGKIVYGEQNL